MFIEPRRTDSDATRGRIIGNDIPDLYGGQSRQTPSEHSWKQGPEIAWVKSMNKRKEKKSRRYARRCPECGSDMVFTKVKKVGSWYKCTADPFHPKVNFVKTKNKSLNKDAMERRFAGSYGSKR